MAQTPVKQKTPVPADQLPETAEGNYFESGTRWHWGLTPSAEIWNGRLAMIGFLSIILIEVFTNQGVLHFWSNILGPEVLDKI